MTTLRTILKREGYTGSIGRIQRIIKRAGIRSNIIRKSNFAQKSTNLTSRKHQL